MTETTDRHRAPRATGLLIHAAARYDLLVWLFTLGTVFGSMLNVAIYRLPREDRFWKALQFMVYPPSHCPRCCERIASLSTCGGSSRSSWRRPRPAIADNAHVFPPMRAPMLEIRDVWAGRTAGF